MDIKDVMRLSGRFLETICDYPFYVRPARSRTERVLRMKRLERKRDQLRSLSKELSACVVKEVRE